MLLHCYFGSLTVTQEGYFRFKVTVTERIFLGLKFSISRFFWLGKFGKYFLGMQLDLSRDFFWFSNNLKIRFMVVPAYLSCKVQPSKVRQKFGMTILGFFWWGVVVSPRIFWSVYFCPH